jgi:cold shock CspA family protein
MQGIVTWFNSGRGYGFIGQDDGPDVFVHTPESMAMDTELCKSGIALRSRSGKDRKARKPRM